jgi:hypothetical protein
MSNALYWGLPLPWKGYEKEGAKHCLHTAKKLPCILMNRCILDPHYSGVKGVFCQLTLVEPSIRLGATNLLFL